MNGYVAEFLMIDIHRYWTQDAIDKAKGSLNAEEHLVEERFDYWEKIRNDPNVSKEEKAKAMAACQEAVIGGFKGDISGAYAYYNKLFDKLQEMSPNPGITKDNLVISPEIDLSASYSFQSAQAWVRRGDPLAFDLDGDGLETTGINTAKPIYFDHDGDGVKTATGWINSDDGLLVYDRNGNGSIDCGRELFGDSTTLAGGTTATDGFAALAAEDSNGDGRVDAADAHFADLRIWRDINGDGISQADELLTLESLGIASISVAKSAGSTSLANGNSIADLGSYTKTDGSTGIIGDINFRENAFLSRFAEAVSLTAETESLPGMHGAGQVRNLQEAASLSTGLAATLATYAAATSGDAQKAQLDGLLKAWSDTSRMATTATGAYAGHALIISFQGVTTGSPEYLAWPDKLTILERFNGQTFRDVPEGGGAVTLAFETPQMDLLNQATCSRY